jgi:hypothetical protein
LDDNAEGIKALTGYLGGSQFRAANANRKSLKSISYVEGWIRTFGAAKRDGLFLRPLIDLLLPSREEAIPYRGFESGFLGGPKVRIHLSPAASQQRTGPLRASDVQRHVSWHWQDVLPPPRSVNTSPAVPRASLRKTAPGVCGMDPDALLQLVF